MDLEYYVDNLSCFVAKWQGKTVLKTEVGRNYGRSKIKGQR